MTPLGYSAIWELSQQLFRPNWGYLFPVHTNLACIGMVMIVPASEILSNMELVIIYSIMAPLILSIGTLAFGILWAFYHYVFLFISDLGEDSGG